MSIDAMKMAIEFLEKEGSTQAQFISRKLRAAITEAERQEPVGYVRERREYDGSFDPPEIIKYGDIPSTLPLGAPLYTTPQPAIPADMVLVSVEPIKTGDPEISREHLVAIAEKCGLLGAYRTREVVDAIVGYGQVILRDKAVQEAMYRASLAAAPKPENDRVEGRDAASSRRVPSHDGLEGNGK